MSVDVLVVGVDSTRGWTEAREELASSVARSGATVAHVGTGPVPKVRTFALTDLTEAYLARRTAVRAIRTHQPRAVIYMSMTAALLWPRRGAISLDSVAAENRPGRHGVWQRAAERRRLAQAPLLLVWSERTLAPIATEHADALLVPFPVRLPFVSDRARDIDVLTYAGDPVKRRLEAVIRAWSAARRDGETMVVAGLDDFSPPEGVSSVGRVSRKEFGDLLQRARVFAAAPSREDFGISALEALANGCRLVTTPSAGPYPAREIAAAADPRLVGEDLAAGIRAALDDPRPGYAERVRSLLDPYSHQAVDRTLASDVLPRLLGPLTT